MKILTEKGYKMVEQDPWGAAEAILYGLPGANAAARSSPDSAVSGKVLPGYVYGANDPRRPSGAAVGY